MFESKLLDNLLGLSIISEISSILFLIIQAQDDCFISSLYPVKLHLFSHKERFLSVNSCLLSLNIISVPFSDVYEKQLSV